MYKDKISIIVPCYNIENYIEHAIRSIMKQTYLNLEIILVNDGSTDDTLEVMRKLADSDDRIYIINKKNEGVTSARLAGVLRATGEWIGFVDGDDIIDIDMYERLLNNAQKYQADISHCGYQMVFPSRVDYYYNTGCIVQQDRLTGLKDLLEGLFVEPGLCNKLFHRHLFQRLIYENLMNFRIKNNEDLLMNFFLFSESSNSVYEDFCPYHYIVRKGSAATSVINENRLRDPLLVQKEIRKYIDNSELKDIVDLNIVRKLIGIATMEKKQIPVNLLHYKSDAKQEIKGMLPMILKRKNNIKIKILALLAAYMPEVYGKIHKVYAHIRGFDKKYEVN